MGFAFGQSFEKFRFINGRAGIAEPAMHTGGFHCRVDTKQLTPGIHPHTTFVRSVLHCKRHHIAGVPVMLNKFIPIDVRQNVPVDQQAGSLHKEFTGIGDGTTGSHQLFFIKKGWLGQIRAQPLSPFLKELRFVMQIHREVPDLHGSLYGMQQAFNQRDPSHRQQRLGKGLGYRAQAGSQPG